MNKIYGITGLLLVICVFTALMNPDAFLDPFNLQNTLKWIAEFGILAIGVSLVIMTAGIDLSIGSAMALIGVLFAMFLVEDINTIDGHKVISASAADKQLTITADSSKVSNGDQYLYAGVVHTITSSRDGTSTQNDTGQTLSTSIVSVEPAPMEDRSGEAVRIHPIQKIDRKAFTLEGELNFVSSQDKIALVLQKADGETITSTFAIANIEVNSGYTVFTLTDDLRIIDEAQWETIRNAKYAMLLKRNTPMTVPIAIVVVLLISVGIGLFHGISITKFGMQPFIVTLCGLLFYRGIARYITSDQTKGFGTGYQELKYLVNGKPFSMAFVILLGGALQFIFYAIRLRNAKRAGETNLTPYRIGAVVGLIMLAVGSSRYVFSYLPLGKQEIVGQYAVQSSAAATNGSGYQFKTIGKIDSLLAGDVIYYGSTGQADPKPFTVQSAWIDRESGRSDDEPITHITVKEIPATDPTSSGGESGAAELTLAYRVIFVDTETNELVISGRHKNLVRGDALHIQGGAGAGHKMFVQSAITPRSNTRTIVVVDSLPADIDATSLLTVAMSNPRPQKIPGYLLVFLGAGALAWGLFLAVKRMIGRDWAKLRSPITMTIGGTSALLVGLTPIPLILVPMPFVIMVVIALVASIFVNQTIYGRYILALGRNEQAARYSGINTNRMIILTYVLCSLAAGVGAILFALEVNSVAPSTHGSFYELFAIAAAVLGGCSLRGGEGSILGVVIGMAVLRVLLNATNILGIDTTLEYAIIGAVIYMGVLVDEMVKRWASKRRAAREARLAMTGQ